MGANANLYLLLETGSVCGFQLNTIVLNLISTVMLFYLHFHCESLNEPLHLRCPSNLHEQIDLKCMFMLFNILLYSQINISLWTNFIFTDHLSIWLVNYRSFYSRLSNLLGAAILQLLAHINLS